MGKQRKGKQYRHGVVGGYVGMAQLRERWLDKRVSFDLGQGEGVQYGRVTSISGGGDVVVVCLPGSDWVVPSLMMSVGFLDQVLTLVEE